MPFVPSGLLWISLLPAHSPWQPEAQAGQTAPLPLPSPSPARAPASLPRRRLTRRARSCHCPSHRGGWDRQRGFSIRGTLSDAKRAIFAAGRISNERCSRTFLEQHRSCGPGSLCHCGRADPARPRSARPAGQPLRRDLPAASSAGGGTSKTFSAASRGDCARSPGHARSGSRPAALPGELPGGRGPESPGAAAAPERAARSPRPRRAGARLPAAAAPPGAPRHVFPKAVPPSAGPDAPRAGLGSAACGAARPRSTRPAAAASRG